MSDKPIREHRISKSTLSMLSKKFGRLTVVGFERQHYGAEKTRTRYRCECICDCGRRKVAAAIEIRRGDISSCGCLRIEAMASTGAGNFEFGQTVSGELRKGRTSTYRAWKKIKDCCKEGILKGFHLACHEFDPRWEVYAEFLKDFGEIGFRQTISRKDRMLPWSLENCYVNSGGNQSNRVERDEIAADPKKEKIMPRPQWRLESKRGLT